MGEKLIHVVMVAVVVSGILPLLGLLASPPDIKGNHLSFTSETIFFSIKFSVSFNYLQRSSLSFFPHTKM